MSVYTIEGALCWGISNDHFKQAPMRSHWLGRAVEWVTGVVETVPLIGQLISLIELGVVKFFFSPTPPSNTAKPNIDLAPQLVKPLPKPVSVIPRLTLIKSQEPSKIPSRYWPTDLKILGLTEDQKNFIDTHLQGAYQSPTIEWKKKNLKYLDVDVQLPLSIVFLKVDSILQCFLFSKTIFAQGGERKIRWVFNVSTGEFLLKKKIVGFFEQRILQILFQDRACRGIKNDVIWRKSMDKKGQIKEQAIEKVRDGTISILFGTEVLESFSTKKELITDLLQDLKALHNIEVKAPVIKIKKKFLDDELYPLPSYNAFHHDITFANVLVFSQNGRWRSELCDFGQAAANPTVYTYSIGFTPPEYIRFYETKRPLGISWPSSPEDVKATVDFNIKYAKARDLWSMGLVIVSILRGQSQKIVWEEELGHYHAANIPSLPCIKEVIRPNRLTTYEETGIKNLTQEWIDRDLDNVEQEVKKKHAGSEEAVGSVFKLVRQMLRIDPQERVFPTLVS